MVRFQVRIRGVSTIFKTCVSSSVAERDIVAVETRVRFPGTLQH